MFLSSVRRFIPAIFIIATVCFLGWLYEEVTGDFNVENISFELPVAYNSSADSFGEVSRKVLDQEFAYLGKGRQTYVFASEDGRYVLKFFQFKRLKPSPVAQLGIDLPVIGSYFVKQEDKRQRRLEKLFSGYCLADLIDRENSGIILTHLTETENLFKKIKVADWFGLVHEIDLDKVAFALQMRGRAAREVISQLLDAGQVSVAVEKFEKLIEMYRSEYALGLIDQDHNIMHNCGFVGGKPIRMDVGQLSYDLTVKDPHIYKQDLDKIIYQRISGWLQRHYPRFKKTIIEKLSAGLSAPESL